MSVQAASGYYGGPPQVDFGWLSQGWEMFKRDTTTWILAMLIAGLIGIAVIGGVDFALGLTSAGANAQATPTNTMGWLRLFLPRSIGQVVGAMLQYVVTTLLSAGLYRMAIKQVRGQAISVGDLFAIGDVIAPVLVFSLIRFVLSYCGTLLCCIPGLIVDGLLLFAPLYIVAEGASPMDAITRSFNALKGQWLMATLYYFVASLFVGLSVLACCVGELAAAPVFILSVAIGFTQFNGGTFTPGAPNYGPNVPGTWPPPPGAGQPYGQTLQPPYGTPPAGPSFGQSPQAPQPPLPPQPPQAPWQPPQQGPGQPPQGGGQWLGGNNPGDGTPGQ